MSKTIFGGVMILNPEAQEYYDIAAWSKLKVEHHAASKYQSVKRRNICHGEVWFCDLGYNIGTEKNKTRPVLIMSNNQINRSEKVVVICITDAKNKVNSNNLPIQNSWFLLYSNTQDPNKMVSPGRLLPAGATTYSFLDKDSIVQCEEIRAVSKARFDMNKGCLGVINAADLATIKAKFRHAYNL